jgi:hypothetical protein
MECQGLVKVVERQIPSARILSRVATVSDFGEPWAFQLRIVDYSRRKK